MSTATIANIVVVLALLGVSAPIARWWYRHDRTASTRHNEFIAETLPDPVLPAAPDNAPGVNLAWADECELIESLGVYTGPDLDAGLDRLRRAIRDEQQKGEQA